MEEKPVTEKRFGECRYHMHKQHMLAYLDGLFHTQFWPHSIFTNNHAVTYFLTVSLTHCHISNSVWQYTAVTNGFHINSPKKIKKRKVFLKKNNNVPPCLIRHVQFYLTF